MFNIGTKNLFLSHLNIPFKGKSWFEFINALFSLHLKNPIFAFILAYTSTNVNLILGNTVFRTVSTENAESSTSIQLGLDSGIEVIIFLHSLSFSITLIIFDV